MGWHAPACRFQTSSTGPLASNTVEAFAAFTFRNAVLTGLDVPSRIGTVQTTRNLLDVWGITPQLGRTFADDEAAPGREQVVLVSHGFWQRQLAASSDAIGKPISIDGRAHTIVGVLPADVSRGIFRTIDAVTPIVLDRERNRRDDRRLFVTARAQTWRPDRTGPGRSRRHCQPAPDRLPRHQREDRRRGTAASRAPRRQHQRRRLSVVRDRVDRVLHRLREHLEHHPRARRGAPSRARRALGTGRGTAAAGAAAHDREPRHVVGRRRGGAAARMVGADCHPLCQREPRRLRRDGPERTGPCDGRRVDAHRAARFRSAPRCAPVAA